MRICKALRCLCAMSVGFGMAVSCFSQQYLMDDNVNREIPAGWIVRDTASGDLNKDGSPDLALVIQNNDKSKYQTRSGGYDSINSNERVLLIFFKHGGSYTLINKIDKIIPDHVNTSMEDPYVAISITKGILQTGYYFWTSFGSWLMYTTYYKFRYQNEAFYLIGIEHDSTHRGTMEREKISVNFSTGKANIITITPDGADEKTTSEWKTFKHDQLYKITDVVPTSIQVLDKYL